MLWTATSYLLLEERAHYIAGITALFMSGVVATYWLYAPEGLQLGYGFSVTIGLVVVGGLTIFYGV